MDYKVVITIDAEKDLEKHIKYLIEVKKNDQSARSVLNDFEETKESLSRVAGSLQFCKNPKLRKLGYRRINYLHHDYFMLYRVVDDLAIVDSIFHFLEDYENKINWIILILKVIIRELMMKTSWYRILVPNSLPNDVKKRVRY